MSDEVFDAGLDEGIPQGVGSAAYDDDIVTPEMFKELTGPKVVPAGQYRMRVGDIKFVPPTETKPGGDRVSFKIVQPLNGAVEPERGWPPITRTFKKYLKYTKEGHAVSERIDREQKMMLIKACGIEPTGPTSVRGMLESCKGSEVLVTVTVEQYMGVDQMNIGGFKPIPG